MQQCHRIVLYVVRDTTVVQYLNSQPIVTCVATIIASISTFVAFVVQRYHETLQFVSRDGESRVVGVVGWHRMHDCSTSGAASQSQTSEGPNEPSQLHTTGFDRTYN